MKISKLNEVYGVTSNGFAVVATGCCCCCSTCTCCSAGASGSR